MLPTETDSQGQRWIRKLTEYTHLADHLALAKTVLQLAVAIDRVRTQLDEIGLEGGASSGDSADSLLTGDASHTQTATPHPTQRDGVPGAHRAAGH
jgi:hypothetical protein